MKCYNPFFDNEPLCLLETQKQCIMHGWTASLCYN